MDHKNTARLLNNIAHTFIRQGRFDEAEPLAKHALTIREKIFGYEHQHVASTLLTLSTIYYEQGLYTKAESFVRRAIDIYERSRGLHHPDVAHALHNISVNLNRQERAGESEIFYRRAIAIYEKTLGSDHLNVAMSLNGLAVSYNNLGRFDEAEILHKRALDIFEKAFGLEHPDIALSLNNTSLVYASSGKFEKAKFFNQRAIEIYEKQLEPDHPDVFMSLENNLDIQMKIGDFVDALPLVRRLISSVFITKKLLPIAYTINQNKLIENSEALSMSLSIMQASNVTGARDAVSKFAQRFSAGRGEQADLIRGDQDLTNQWAAMDKLLTEQFSKAPDLRNKDAEANIRQRIAEIESERKGIAATLAARFPDYVALTKPPVLNLADIQALLADDEALIAFDVAEKGYTWVITRETADWTEVPTTAATLTSEVLALRSTLAFEEGKPAKPFDAALAYKIYQQTLGPLEDKFAGKKRLSVYVNGALSSFPLQLLVIKDPTGKTYKDIDWLVKSAAITHLPSIYALKAMRRELPPSKAPRAMAAFADPVFSRDPATDPSPKTRTSLRGIGPSPRFHLCRCPFALGVPLGGQ